MHFLFQFRLNSTQGQLRWSFSNREKQTKPIYIKRPYNKRQSKDAFQ